MFTQPDEDVASAPTEPDLVHLGHLEGQDFAFGDSLIQRRITKSQAALDAFEASDSLRSIAKESDILFNLALNEAYSAAFRNGDYAVFKNKSSGHMLAPEGLHVLNFGGSKDGEGVLVCVYVDESEFPEVRNAEQYRNRLSREYWLDEARKFNALPLSERKRIVARGALPRGLRLLDGNQYEGRLIAEPLKNGYVAID